MFELLLGRTALVTGIADDTDDDGTPLLRVYIGPRYHGRYVLCAGDDIEKVRREWRASSMGHLFTPLGPDTPIYVDEPADA